jgi:hypothetical protein
LAAKWQETRLLLRACHFLLLGLVRELPLFRTLFRIA